MYVKEKISSRLVAVTIKVSLLLFSLMKNSFTHMMKHVQAKNEYAKFHYYVRDTLMGQ